MLETDDFYVMNDNKNIDLNKAIENYKYFKNASVPDNHLRKYFYALLQDKDSKMLFRKKEIADNPLQQFWTLRFIDMAENDYNDISITKYSSIEKKDLKEIVNMCFSNNIIIDTKKYLMKKGIYIFFIEPISGTKIDGAVYSTSHSTIAIGLTVRFERLDHLWFTLLHELSHIILHYNYLTEEGIISIENSQDEIEVEANRLAKEAIISPEIYRVCKPKRTRDSGDLRKYAQDNNIPPELLAGIIRRDLNNYNIFNDIIENFKIKRSDLYE